VKIRDECGVIGVHVQDASRTAILGLQALQHRGQESAGVASFDGEMHVHKAMGLVDAAFLSAPWLPGNWAVGHNRYSTHGASTPINAGPFVQETPLGPVAVAHNGNIVNAHLLAGWLRDAHGLEPESTSDTELIGLLLRVAPGWTWPDRIQWMSRRLVGSYSLVLLAGDRLFGVRDPMGNRPLCLGRLDDGWVLASESCAVMLVGGQLCRDILPGEVLEIGSGGPAQVGMLADHRRAFCAFEYIYIARPDTVIGGRAVHGVRRAIGEELGSEHPVDADLVIGVPDSGTSAALGYSAATRIPFGEGLIKNRYVGRTFIHPTQSERERLIRMKFGALPLQDKRIVLVDDSIVRGNTLRPIVGLLREAGAVEIHVRIASPPITDPCYLGVDMASRDELIANRLDEPAVSAHVRADSLRHVSIDGLLRALRGSRNDTCLGCFTGQYPIPVETQSEAVLVRELVEVPA
jgi:amidophosphoribosyltransferase